MTTPGDLLTSNYQFQLHETLYGTGSNGVSLDLATPIAGLGVPDTKSQDVVYNFADGSYGNPDYNSVRTVTIPVVLRKSTYMTDLKALCIAWAPIAADTDLSFELPGWGKFTMNGRPRGVVLDMALMRFGAVRALLRFDCLNPTITYL